MSEEKWISYSERLTSLTEEELESVLSDVFTALKKDGTLAKTIGRNSMLQKKYFPGMRISKIKEPSFRRAVTRAVKTNDDTFLGPFVVDKWTMLNMDLEQEISTFFNSTTQQAAYEQFKNPEETKDETPTFALHHLIYKKEIPESRLRLFLKMSGNFEEDLFNEQLRTIAEIEQKLSAVQEEPGEQNEEEN